MYVDVGGGSTEISIIVGNELADSQSFNMGTIRILLQNVSQAEMDKMNDFLTSIKEK